MDALQHIVKKYNIDLSQKGPFYLSAGRYKCLPTLYRELGFKIGAEIGVHRGQYSRSVLKRIPGLKLYLVDLWESYPGYKDVPGAMQPDAYNEAVKNTEGYDVVFIKEWSHIAANQFEDESLDFVYLDANHAFEFVVQDIAIWSKKVKKGGIVAGHDYDDYSKTRQHYCMQVIPAVNAWVDVKRIHPLFIFTNNPNNSWLYVK